MRTVSAMAHEDLEWRSDEAEMVSALLGAFEQIGNERKSLKSIAVSPLKLFSRRSDHRLEGAIRIGSTSTSVPVSMDDDDLKAFPFLRREAPVRSDVVLKPLSHTSHASPKFWWRRLIGPKAGGPVAY